VQRPTHHTDAFVGPQVMPKHADRCPIRCTSPSSHFSPVASEDDKGTSALLITPKACVPPANALEQSRILTAASGGRYVAAGDARVTRRKIYALDVLPSASRARFVARDLSVLNNVNQGPRAKATASWLSRVYSISHLKAMRALVDALGSRQIAPSYGVAPRRKGMGGTLGQMASIPPCGIAARPVDRMC
jgi:hypothetical protein